MTETTDEGVPTLYLRALYWALVTTTTVGHVDRLTSIATGWETVQAIVVCLVVSLVYIFVVGNATALLLKKHQQVPIRVTFCPSESIKMNDFSQAR